MVLPQPLGPTTAIVSPKPIARFRSSQHQLVGLVAKADVLELQVAVVADERGRRFRVADPRLAVEPGEDPVGRGKAGLQTAENVGHLPQGIGHAGQHEEERQHVGPAQRPVAHADSQQVGLRERISQDPATIASETVVMPRASVMGWVSES